MTCGRSLRDHAADIQNMAPAKNRFEFPSARTATMPQNRMRRRQLLQLVRQLIIQIPNMEMLDDGDTLALILTRCRIETQHQQFEQPTSYQMPLAHQQTPCSSVDCQT